jgi:hypothetical protein
MKESNKLIAEFMGEDISNDLQYHASWDWIMPVVKKCYQEHKSRHIVYDVYIIAEAVMTCDINKVYQVIIEFIKKQNN